MRKWLENLFRLSPEPQVQTQDVSSHQAVKLGDLSTEFQNLPLEGRVELFYEAVNQRNVRAVETILQATDIPGRYLTDAFFNACTRNLREIAHILVQRPETDVNWINPRNFHLTPAMRAAMNDQSLRRDDDYGPIIEMILDRPDFNPNTLSQEQGSSLPKTIVTQVFGYKPKDSIPAPNEAWKARLLSDLRINWDQHASYIPLAEEAHRQSKAAQEERERAEPAGIALQQRVSAIRAQLGLAEPGLFD